MADTAKQRQKVLVQFNIQNLHYALFTDNAYSKPISYGTAIKVALEADSSVKKIYGDGKRIASIMNDKGKTGNWTTNNIDDEFEIAMGRKMRIKNGLASIKQQKIKRFAFYFETCGLAEDNSMPLAKTWVYGVTSTVAPSESYDQNTDDINESQFETALEIGGIELKDESGKIYKDPETGQPVYVWQLTSTPGDAGFETFGETVPMPSYEEIVNASSGDGSNA